MCDDSLVTASPILPNSLITPAALSADVPEDLGKSASSVRKSRKSGSILSDGWAPVLFMYLYNNNIICTLCLIVRLFWPQYYRDFMLYTVSRTMNFNIEVYWEVYTIYSWAEQNILLFQPKEKGWLTSTQKYKSAILYKESIQRGRLSNENQKSLYPDDREDNSTVWRRTKKRWI